MREASGERHRHECPLCGVTVTCADRLPHCVGHPPTIRMSGELEPEQRYKLCDGCARREMKEKDLKVKLGGDLAILAQLVEYGLPPLNPVDLLAEALVTRRRGQAEAALDALHGQTEKQARRLALRVYERMRRMGERDAALTVMRRYKTAAFKNTREVYMAALRLRKKPAR